MEFIKGKKIILASNSPRRRELLSGLDIPFEIDTRNNFEEEYSMDTPHEQIPALMSEGKSYGFHRPLKENEILITSDTMVFLGENVLGKPHSREQAIEMLTLLCGNAHTVITAVTIRSTKGHKTFSDRAQVHFRALSREEIEYYIDKYKPYDKAGSYGIQEWLGYAAITRLEGSVYTVMGLPTHLILPALAEIG